MPPPVLGTPAARSLAATALLAIAATAQDPGRAVLDVLRDGGAEDTAAALRGRHRGQPYFAVDAWTGDRDGAWVAQASGWGGIDAAEGGRFLRPTSPDAGALWQEVTLGGEPTHLCASVRLRGDDRDDDRLDLVVELLDADGEVERTARCGGPLTGRWVGHRMLLSVAAGDRHHRPQRARVRLVPDHRGGRYLDAYADDVRLWLLGPDQPPALAAVATRDLEQRLDGASSASEHRARCALLWQLLRRQPRRWVEAIDTMAQAAGDDPEQRDDLLTLLAVGGGRAAVRPLRSRLEAAGSDRERAALLQLLRHAGSSGDWLRQATAIVRDAGAAPALRGAACVALAEDGSATALRPLLAAWPDLDPEVQLAVLQALAAAAVDVDDVYRGLLQPSLAATADPARRDAAMAVLGRHRDRRLPQHVLELLPAEDDRARRGRWLAWCADLGTVAAAEAMVALTAAGEARADTALIADLPRMLDPAVLAWVRARGLRHEHAAVRLASARALGAAAVATDAGAVLALAADPDAEVADAAVLAAVRCDAAAVQQRLAAATPALPPAAFATALHALRDADAPAGELLRTALGHRDGGVRAAALRLLADADAAAAAADDPDRRVRVTAFAVLADHRRVASVAALMARLPREGGTALLAACRALEQLTGERKPIEAEAWLRWWERAGGDYHLPAARAATEAAPADVATAAVRYHGTPLLGDAVAFVVDLSGSMRDPFADGGPSKLQVAQRELQATLRALAPAQRFSILGFADSVRAYSDRLVAATPDEVERASRWIDGLEARGWTDLYDAVAAALALDGVEVVCVLSDGAPSVGRYVRRAAVREQLRQRNRHALASVHTFAIGGGERDHAFLRQLAEDGAGSFRAVRE